MEQRKLMQHGASSLTLAIPSKWIKNHSLKKGDSLHTYIEGNKVILSTTQTKKLEKITINVAQLDRTSILLYVQSLYRYGYNEIEIIFEKQTTIHYRKQKQVSISSIIHEIDNRCVGAEIIEQTEKRILMKAITKDADEDFSSILRRIFLLVNETANTLLDAIKKNNKVALASIEDMHDTINKFVNYCLRLLNKYGYSDVKKTCLYYHIIASIDKIVDILKYNARDILKSNIIFNKEAIYLVEQINYSIRLYYRLFYQFNKITIHELSKKRDSIKLYIEKNQRRIPNGQLMLVINMKYILEIILDLTEFRMGLEY
jgi:phosphate uptake regulator